MNHSWNTVPLVRLVIPLISGILYGIFFPSDVELELFLITLFLIFIVFLFEIKEISKQYHLRWISGSILNILFFCAGILLAEEHSVKSAAEFPYGKNEKKGLVIATIEDQPQEKKASYKTFLSIPVAMNGVTSKRKSYKILAYFAKDSLSSKLNYGDVILLSTLNIIKVPDPANPGDFDYKGYLARRGVFFQVFLQGKDWRSTGLRNGNQVITFAINLRDQLLRIFLVNGIAGEQYAVISALILGYVDDIDPSLTAAYSGAGANHILSVSGLHVGIIYLVLNYILLFFGEKKWARIIRTIFLLLFLWFYALLTGLSPAVLRSAMMLSFVVIGNSLKRATNIYNTLAASVMVLLLFDPKLILEVGFQLSYLAVLGIVAIHPVIYERYSTNSWLKDKIWASVSVSFSAQLSTFPLGFYYFHQFPVYFLFSNMIVIPLSTLIIYAGIGLMVVSPFHWISCYAGIVVDRLVWLLNSVVKTVEVIPCSLIKGVMPTVPETITIYVLIFFLFLFFTSKKFLYFFCFLLSVLAFCIQISFTKFNHQKQKSIEVYSIPGVTAIDLVSGNKNILISDSDFIGNKFAMQSHLANNWWERGVGNHLFLQTGINENPDHVSLEAEKYFYKKNNFILFHDKTIYLPDHPVKKGDFFQTSFTNEKSGKMTIDYVILSKNTKVEITGLLLRFDVRKIIFDSSNKKWRVEKWKKECRRLGMPCYDIAEKGAFILEF